MKEILERDMKLMAKVAKQVIVATTARNIPLTPQYYRLWFDFYAGRNKELGGDIKSIEKTGQMLTTKHVEALYQKHYESEGSEEIVDRVGAETQKLLKTIFSDILNAGQNQSSFGNKLDGFVDELGNTEDMGQIQGIIKSIIDETNTMAESSRALEKKLDQATQTIDQLKENLDEVRREANTDALTGLANRKAFDAQLEQLYGQFKSESELFSVILIDLDHFKSFNDTYGHQAGDEVLRLCGATIRNTTKGLDFPARYGGEEFVVLLPATHLQNACIVAENLRTAIAAKRLKNKKTGQYLRDITASLGVACVNGGDSAESVVDRADAALYHAKETGRNRVCSETDLNAAAA